MKKLISAFGLLAIATPVTLSVIACSDTSNDIDNVIKGIEELKNLIIDIPANANEATVITILNDYNKGVGSIIADEPSVANKFDLKLFALDLDNIYFEVDKVLQKVSKNDKIKPQTYYFKFTYHEQQNNILVPVKIMNTEAKTEQKVVDAIKHVKTYKIDTIVKTSLAEFKATIDGNFIQNYLEQEIQNIFDVKKLAKIRINKDNETELKEEDLTEAKVIEGYIIFDYGIIKDIKVKLIIKIQDHQKIVDTINSLTYMIEIAVNSKVSALEALINGTFIQTQYLNHSLPIALQQDFNIYLFKLSVIWLNGQELTEKDLEKSRVITTELHYYYGNISGKTTLIIKMK